METCTKVSAIKSIINDHISTPFPHVIILANVFVLIISFSKKNKKKMIEESYRRSKHVGLEHENLNGNSTILETMSHLVSNYIFNKINCTNDAVKPNDMPLSSM